MSCLNSLALTKICDSTESSSGNEASVFIQVAHEECEILPKGKNAGQCMGGKEEKNFI